MGRLRNARRGGAGWAGRGGGRSLRCLRGPLRPRVYCFLPPLRAAPAPRTPSRANAGQSQRAAGPQPPIRQRHGAGKRGRRARSAVTWEGRRALLRLHWEPPFSRGEGAGGARLSVVLKAAAARRGWSVGWSVGRFGDGELFWERPGLWLQLPFPPVTTAVGRPCRNRTGADWCVWVAEARGPALPPHRAVGCPQLARGLLIVCNR